jgi:hypothetical protein
LVKLSAGKVAIKPFLKRFALRRLITPLPEVWGQGPQNSTVTPLRAFGQAFRRKGCDQTFFEKVCGKAFFKKFCNKSENTN